MPQSPRMKQPTSQAKKKADAKKSVKRGKGGGGGGRSDDESIDERGNIRDLIVSDESEESDSSCSEDSLTISERRALKKTGKLPKRLAEQIRHGSTKPPPRKAAVVALKKIKKENRRRVSPATSSSDSTFQISEEEEVEKKKKVKIKKSHG